MQIACTCHTWSVIEHLRPSSCDACMMVRQAVPRLINLVLQDTAAQCPGEVVVVGGAIRIPRVQKVLQSFLEQQGAVMRKTVDIDRGLSLGAPSPGPAPSFESPPLTSSSPGCCSPSPLADYPASRARPLSPRIVASPCLAPLESAARHLKLSCCNMKAHGRGVCSAFAQAVRTRASMR